jgi:cytidylate kinase
MTVIAMTREIGSLGTEVAAGVAKRLGLEIIRSEVAANNVARRLGVAESAVTRYLDGSASLLERWQIDRRKLFHYASEEILSLAQRGNVLIKGWGAATLLRDVPQVISVRVCAPMDFRVRVMMERQGRKDAATVREEIERFDTARARTLRAYFNVDQEDARLYHIVLNTERLSVDACVDAVCKLAEGKRFRDTFTSRSALANKLLEAKISSAFVEHISVAMAPLGLSVSVANGKVTLAGTSCSGSLRKQAEKIAHATVGMLQIDNRIVSVPTRGSAFLNSEWIDARSTNRDRSAPAAA